MVTVCEPQLCGLQERLDHQLERQLVGAEQLATVAVIAEACLSPDSKSRQVSDGPGTPAEQSLWQSTLHGPAAATWATEQRTAACSCNMHVPLDPAPHNTY